MRIAIIYGAMTGYDHGLSAINKITKDILDELGVTVEEVNLSFTQIPFYDGITSKSTEAVIKLIQSCEGVVFATTAQLFAPSGVMQCFLEHLSDDEHKGLLKDKNCMLISVSKDSGERSAIEYLSKVVNSLGGYDPIRIGIGGKEQKAVSSDPKTKEIIEKQIEDYYRIVRQGRKYIIPKDSFAGEDLLTTEELQTIAKSDKVQKASLEDIYKKVNLDNFTKRQEEDINEITNFFAGKYSQGVEPKPEITESKVFKPLMQTTVTPRNKSCKQMTQSLPHYFQTQLSAGYTFNVQLSISGPEIFDGYIVIANSECNYYEGVVSMPDITILTDANVWRDILQGKHTAQKAFMTGQLKVRGNFVILSKFEQLFNKMQ